MASITIVLRDPTTGAGLPGQSLKFRHSADSFAADLSYVFTEIDSLSRPGAYKTHGVDTETYKLWVNGSEDPTFGADEGIDIFEKDDLMIKVGDIWDARSKKIENVTDATTAQGAYTKAQAEAAHYTKAQSDALVDDMVTISDDQTITSNKLFEKLPRAVGTDDDPEIPEPTEDGELVPLKYLNQILATLNINPLLQSPQEIWVWGGATNSNGKRYGYIKDAVSSAFAQTPTVSKQFSILVKQMGPGVEYMNAGAGSLKSFVHLIAAGRFINIIMQDNSLLSESRIENATLYFGAGVITTDREFNKLELVNCKVYHYRNITWNNGGLINSTLIAASGYKSIIKNACNVENCIFSEEPDFDSHTGVALYDSVSGVFSAPADPTVIV